MKRLFQRPSSSSALSRGASKDSSLSSPDSAGDGSPKRRERTRERRSYSPEKLASVFRKASPEKRAAQAAASTTVYENQGENERVLKRTASASISDDELHGKVVEYMTGTTEAAQDAALRDIHAAILEDVAASGVRLRVSQKDTDKLVSVCSQRLRLAFQRRLDAFNAALLHAPAQAPPSFLIESDDGLNRFVVGLGVLQDLLSEDQAKATNHVILVVSERLPSTLVKVLKACAQSGVQPSNDGIIADLILAVLSRLVRFQETVYELTEASTLHRLFHVTFESTERQFTTLQVIEALVESTQGALWDAILSHLHDHRCLLELLAIATNAKSLVKVLAICARVLRAAYERNHLALHKQLRVDQFYISAFSTLQATFKVDGNEAQQDQQDLRLAIGELCLSGSESAMVVADVTNDQCFALCTDKAPSKVSFFNAEAFMLVCQVLDFLHQQCEERSTHDRSINSEEDVAWCRSLECQYIQKIGRLIAENRFDYVLIRRSGIMEQLLRRLNKLSDLSKHAVGSVLAATAIEACVIPYSELNTIGVYIGHATQSATTHDRNSDLLVLLGFVVNLLRFDDAYRSILRTTGVIESTISLFQAQTVLFSFNEVPTAKINIAYPTSQLKIGHSSWHRRHSPGGGGGDWVLPVNEKNLIMFLTSHCRQNNTARKIETHHAVDRRVFGLVLEVLTAFADQATANTHGANCEFEDEDALRVGLCEPPVLECICALLANRMYQDTALFLWAAIIRISLRIKKQNTSTYNAVNCFLQSLRYVGLSLYYEHEPGVKFAFQASVDVLRNGLNFLEDAIRPEDSNSLVSRKDESPRTRIVDKANRDRLLLALADSGGLYTCLAVCCALNRALEGDAADTDTSDATWSSSDSAFVFATRLVHILVASNASVGELFNGAVSFDFYGRLINRYVSRRINDHKRQNRSYQSSALLCQSLLQGLIGFSVNDYAIGLLDPGRKSLVSNTVRKVTQPGALIVLIQLLRLWSSNLQTAHVDQFLHEVGDLLAIPENARLCGQASLCDVLLESFAVISDSPSDNAVDTAAETESLQMSLLHKGSRYHATTLGMLERAVSGGISHNLACRWIKLIVDASASLSTVNPNGDFQPAIVATPMLRVLVQLAIGASADLHKIVPSISFDSSREGFAQMQIPEVLVRAQGASSFQSPGQNSVPASSSSSSAFAGLSSKVWPPPDGYTAMVWFRIDANETKDAREKHYWDMLMKNLCVLCHNAMKDEASLKCSHRACRACQEALANCGGECVVCNPPMFYLFRFRSGDTKSVSEMFLRGSKLYMRTSGTTKTGVHQFSHAPLQIGKWYHIAMVHSRQRFQSSQVSLYLNGLLQETVKISYPSGISSGQPLTGLIGIPSQARRLSTSRWTIGSFYLLDEPLSPHLVNAAFAVGPSYGGLYVGPSGSNELLVSVDHLSVESLLLLDEYTRDPIRSLIESVEAAERSGKNSILRSSLSLASAASSAAAAIVQDIKARSTSSGIFARIPSAVPIVSMPLAQDRITLVYSSSTAVGIDLSVIPSSKLDGRPLAQLLGGAEISPSFSLADTLHDACGSGPRFAYVLLEQAANASEVELTLELLWQMMRCHPKNMKAMEYEHGYGVVNFLLHQKSGVLLTVKALAILFRIVGIDIEEDSSSSSKSLPARARAIRNLLALQHFILDYTLWQTASTSTQKLLFSSLYASMMTGGDELEALARERNRAQLQSLSLVRQLLYVFLDPAVDSDLLRVIADLILVCLTGTNASNRNESATVETNFAEIASFLASSLSPRFARNRDIFDDGSSSRTPHSPRDLSSESQRGRSDRRRFDLLVDSSPDMQSPVNRLCLSPRGRSGRLSSDRADGWMHAKSLPFPSSNPVSIKTPSSPSLVVATPTIRMRQTQAQDMLLDILAKAVQKHDLKENRERDDTEGIYVENVTGTSTLPTPTAGGSTSTTAGQRLQMPTSMAKLTGFRRVLSPRWIGYFLFPTADSSSSAAIAPSTVIAALKLLAALLNRPRYENVFRKDGYYRLLSQGLPCDHRAFLAIGSLFPFDQMWYALLCMLLGPPVDGMPHEVKFDMYYLTKDFALNVQRDRLVNANMSWVMLALMRRHYNDPVAFATLRMVRVSPEKSIMAQVSHVLYAKSPEDTLCHAQVLDFLHHAYTSMPALHKLLVLSQGSSSSQNTSAASGRESKLRGEILEELSLLACGAARAELFMKYAPSEKRVHQTLLNQKRDLNAFEFAICTVEIADQSAAEDLDGEDPFQHPVAVRAMKVLVAILCDFLVLHPKGVDHVEAFFDSHAGSALAPPLHGGLQLRFQTLILMSLLEQVRVKFADESVLSEHKEFASNIKEFMALSIQKMHMWQRAQHGDACPTAFACCGDKFHFTGGPFVLLDLALYFLGDTTAGVTASMSSASTSSSIGQMIQEKLNSSSKSGKPPKRRHTLKSMILGKVQFGSSKSAELEGLATSMYSAVNAVILHVLQGHGSEVSDDECETLLQLVHVHREVVLNTRNTQDREFLICLCRFLLQLLSAGGAEGRTSVGEYDRALQEIAAQIWIDLMQLQRPLMVELLTVELRRAGGTPYVVNLMKNGFDVLLECPRADLETSPLIIESAAFKKFKGWLDIVGPPLKELETNLDRVFVKRMVEAKEVVRDAWAAAHKRQAHRLAKDTKRFASRFEWFASMEREYFEALVDAQQNEFRRQLKWRQDRVDRQKFHARQWQKLRHELMLQALRDCESNDADSLASEIARRNRVQQSSAKQQRTSWLLDATEGPSRMRKRLIAKVKEELEQVENNVSSPAASRINKNSKWSDRGHAADRPYVRRRRYSESDVDDIRALENAESIVVDNTKPDQIQLRPRKKKEQVLDEKKAGRPRPVSRRLSFENVLRAMQSDAIPRSEAEDVRSAIGASYRRKDSALSATNDNGSGDEDDHDPEEKREEGSSGFGDDDDADAIDEKLRPLLVPGDEILDIYDCLRVDGMDACPGVFILCSDHLYIVDNYQLVLQYGPALEGATNRRGQGAFSETLTTAKVMEVSTEAPTRLERRLSLRFQLPSPAIDGPRTPSGTLTMQRSTFTHQCRFWAYEDVVELHKRRHQLRHVALELFAHDGRNYLMTFESPQQRENVFHSLLAKCPNVRGAANGMDRSTASGDLYSQLKKLLRQNMTERWISREISNFEYLMHLNTLAGRSYNDLTQYPVFPWVLSDYMSATLDLTDPAVYRDLTKPMGALYRKEEFRTRYESLLEGGTLDMDDPMAVKPFHYGTHYSSAGIVLHYLMRMEPFTTHFLRLQGGKFDHADRLFSCVASAWKSAAGMDNAHNGTQDVKELTPEFFYLPSFLKNLNHHEFGRDQNGLAVDDVELPPWANGSAREFVRINREALESPHVSANLHHWIDLIFGHKQQGPAAVDACNVFYHLTYEGAVDLDAITDLAMRRAMVDQISEFGQTPSQLFKTPHPPRLRVSTALPISSSSSLSSSVSLGVESGGSTFGGTTVGSPPPPTSTSGGSFAPGTTRGTLASSFIEGSDLVSRMHSILTNTSSLGGTPSSLLDDSTAILDHAALLQQEPRREIGLNPVVAAHRGHHQHGVATATCPYGSSAMPPIVSMRTRQLSSGVPAAPIFQIAMTSASVTRDERVAAVGDRCLLIPPRHHDFFAWGFQDRSLKVLSTGSSEVAHGSESKMIASFEIEFPISVACMTSDGRTLIAGGAFAPVVRLWQFSSAKTSVVSTGSSASASGVPRKRAYSIGLHSAGQSARSLVPLATLCCPSHRAPITAVQVCRAYSIIVSGCAGGVAVLWDLNRLRYSRTLSSLQPDDSSANREPISAIEINEVTGDIAVACGAIFGVFDVNGELLARLRAETLLHDSQYPRAAITSMAVNRSEASAWCNEKAVVTGHADGVLCIWAYAHTGYGDDEVSIELKGRHMISKTLTGNSSSSMTTTSRSAITAVLLTQDERKLFTGNADGLLSLWTPMAPSGGAPTTPTKSMAASASPLSMQPTSLV